MTHNADPATVLDYGTSEAFRFAAEVVRRHCTERQINHLDAGDLERRADELQAGER
jgi:hypothetical protein